MIRPVWHKKKKETVIKRVILIVRSVLLCAIFDIMRGDNQVFHIEIFLPSDVERETGDKRLRNQYQIQPL